MGTRAVNMQALDALIRPAVEGQGYELVDLQWGRQLGGTVLRVTIDHLPRLTLLPQEPLRVSHTDCVQVSREVSALLDVNDILPGHYSLEVSSPGLDRPLKRQVDFERFIGQRAKVRVAPSASKSNLGPQPEGAAPRRNFIGRIATVENDRVRLDAEGVGMVDLHLAEIEKANLIYVDSREELAVGGASKTHAKNVRRRGGSSGIAG